MFFGIILEYLLKEPKKTIIMKKFYTFCLLLVSVALLAQEAGKAGELLKNEVKDNEKQTLEKSLLQSKNENASERNPVQNGRRNLNNNDYRWNYNYGTAEVFLRIPEYGRFTVELGDQMMQNNSGKFRFFDLRAGKVVISIYDETFLIYRTNLILRNNTRTVLDFFSNQGLFLLGNYPQSNQSYGFNEWDDIWNNPYASQQGNWNGNQGNQSFYGNSNYYGNLMNNQEFNDFKNSVKRDANFDENRIHMIANAAQYSNFTAVQIYELLKTLNFESNRVKLAKQLFRSCVDKQNFYKVYKAFDFESSKREVSEFISK